LTAASTISYYHHVSDSTNSYYTNMETNKQTENGARRQFKMQLDDSFLSKLENAARRFKRRTTQAAAEEILTMYFDHWYEAGEMALAAPVMPQEATI
jgi:hypothetical protein